jgi:uncharacterized protein (DUF2062 family)
MMPAGTSLVATASANAIASGAFAAGFPLPVAAVIGATTICLLRGDCWLPRLTAW